MNAKLIELAEHRTNLVARAATQRAELSRALTSWREALAVVDRGWGALRFIRSYAPLMAGVVGFMIPLRPWRAAKWVRRGLLVWTVARTVKRNLLG